MGIIGKIFGTHSQREIKRIEPLLNATLAFEDTMSRMTDDRLRAQTDKLKGLLSTQTIDDILPEAFATVRETAWRVLGMKHYPVQIIGGIVLHQGRIAEMKTGEGKTMVATLPAYLNALTGKGVHIVTVNDYLAQRDSEWMGKIYRFLGLEVGLVVHGISDKDKKAAYLADITYGTNNEFGFDYLRDNMAIYKERMVQRGHNFAIVDEVDSILIDEARTPLIISGAGMKSTQMYEIADRFVCGLRPFRIKRLDDKADYDKFAAADKYLDIEMAQYITKEEYERLREADYLIDEKNKTAALSAKGVSKAEAFFNIENLSAPENMELSHHINQAIRAHGIMRRDSDYVIADGQIIIVDEFTGRLMHGRRYNQGLHQAIEAKEHVKVEKESKTYASITLQNYFRLYEKLSGMTGTALTEADEFEHIYKLDVVEIPTNRPGIRIDHQDMIYKTERAKFEAVIDQIVSCNQKGQPVLVGTISIEKSELLSALLRRRGIKHRVLNAKHHEKEASIIAQAGCLNAVTIATNMAGRGTDIVLGGNAEYIAKEELRKKGFDEDIINGVTGFSKTDDEQMLLAKEEYAKCYKSHKEKIEQEAEQIKAAGGLFILGTERHESRRIDNQLRGRAARQGDPGETRFYLSLEDDLMRLFGGDRVTSIMGMLKMPEDMPIENRALTASIERAQEKVEGINFQRRKSVLQYDDVMNKQREIIYKQRREVLDGSDITPTIEAMMNDIIDTALEQYISGDEPEGWNFAGLKEHFEGIIEVAATDDTDMLSDIEQTLKERMAKRYEQKRAELGDMLGEGQRVVMLRSVDMRWMEHIDDMDELKRGIGLMAYGQRDPVIEFKFQSYDIFEQMVNNIKLDTIRGIFNLVIREGEQIKREEVAKDTTASHENVNTAAAPVKKSGTTVIGGQSPERNKPCPCGSGLKYKKCCALKDN